MRILWGSPLPPIRSGVSDYAVDLLAEMGSRASVRVLEPPDWTRPTDWPLDDSVELVETGAVADPEEISLVHLGNNPHHIWLLDRIGRPRTVVVLHDLVLHHLLVEAGAEGAGSSGDLAEALESAHGRGGRALARARSLGMTGRRDPFLFPARHKFLEGVAGVVVHSRWGEEQIRKQRPDLPCLRLGLAVMDPGKTDSGSERTRLGIEEEDVVLMHLGFLTPEKGLQSILEGLAAATRLGIPARLVLVGEGRSLGELKEAAACLGLSDRLTTTGWIAPEDFPTVPAAADLGVVLRTPSAGETSAAAVRFLACGVPVAVGGMRQFLEWPELAAPRLTPGPSTGADLARLLASVRDSGTEWEERRRAARETYQAFHRPEQSANVLLEFLEALE
jgi:glycosyltransferase involved in cell wall biosynthesis